ncbi:MAG: hypothetical protein ACJA09_000739 [Alcanivorax sp.]|jgi:hypothetical protein
MRNSQPYPIGRPGEKWGDEERAQWLQRAVVHRSYSDEVLSKLKRLKGRFDLFQYGALSYDVDRYPLFALTSKNWRRGRPAVLVTGGVHGYETSGVQGAIGFLDEAAEKYSDRFNIVVAPCISPWGYETINRWNPYAMDPNRSFRNNGASEEAAALMKMLAGLDTDFLVHLDLHETTDTDESEFRPARAARDGKVYVPGTIPDGFYLVGDSENPAHEFQRAIITAVQQVTHIAPSDSDGKLLGGTAAQSGVINYPVKVLGLCGGVTSCRYGTTTEVYPDSIGMTGQVCIAAQIASVVAALDYASE